MGKAYAAMACDVKGRRKEAGGMGRLDDDVGVEVGGYVDVRKGGTGAENRERGTENGKQKTGRLDLFVFLFFSEEDAGHDGA
jgi:hypothetical protein